MRAVVLALLVSSCAALTPAPVVETPSVQLPAAEEEKKERKHRPAPKPIVPVSVPAPPAPVVVQTPPPQCENLNGGNLKDNIKAKLDCINKSAPAKPAKP